MPAPDQFRIAVASRSFSRHDILCKELLAHFPNVTFNTEGLSLAGEKLFDFLNGCDGAIVALERIDAPLVTRLRNLKCVSKYGVGLDNIDVPSVEKMGIKLGWSGGVNARSVSELTLAFALGMLRNIFHSIDLMNKGQWLTRGGNQLSGKTVGIIGYGHVGRDVARLLQPFGCPLLINDVLDFTNEFDGKTQRAVDKKTIYSSADIISVHVPLDDSTKNMISHDEFSQMKPTAILINTSRGKIVDEGALAVALASKKIAGAAMDVFADEPYTSSDLLAHENFYGTPHIGGSSEEAILAMGRAAIKNLCEKLLS